MSDNKNLLITIALSTLILIGWQYFYEQPRLEKMAVIDAVQKKQKAEVEEARKKVEEFRRQAVEKENNLSNETKEQALENGRRIVIESPAVKGSIALVGGRFDDITLSGYKTELKSSSPDVHLLSPSNSESAYFAEFGWLSADSALEVPNARTLWKADKKLLKPNDTVHLTWNNSQGYQFGMHITLDENYMFHVEQYVQNTGNKEISLLPYGLLNRVWKQEHQPFAILHEGPLGVFNGVLSESHYNDLKDDLKKEFRDVQKGWLGITDKYWLTTIIPDNKLKFNANFSYTLKNNQDRFQVDYLGDKLQLAPGQKISISNYLFTGVKKLSLLDAYAKQHDIQLFDHAVDFGMFYFLTKPMFTILRFFYTHVGNFGVAILLMTIFVKALMYPLANKSYRSMSQMKQLQPELLKLRAQYQEDKLALNKAVMELYKKEKVNPLSGCLPLLIQIPVFFSLYKVLFITIEMRHAPFFGWIHDLSAPDPTSLFNLFGLIPWQPPSFLMIGIWPLIMGFTMWLQQRMNPEPSDPVQAKVMKFLPVLFVYMFHTFPAGLIIYWAWNNILSVLQQWIIMRTLPQKK